MFERFLPLLGCDVLAAIGVWLHSDFYVELTLDHNLTDVDVAYYEKSLSKKAFIRFLTAAYISDTVFERFGRIKRRRFVGRCVVRI